MNYKITYINMDKSSYMSFSHFQAQLSEGIIFLILGVFSTPDPLFRAI